MSGHLLRTTMVDVYVLECEGGNYYVGRTEDGERRLRQHVLGKGAKWTKKHKPKRVVDYYRNMKPSDEKKITERMIKEHGARKVRGGPYVKTKMTQAELRALEKKVGMKTTTRAKPRGGTKPRTRTKTRREPKISDKEMANFVKAYKKVTSKKSPPPGLHEEGRLDEEEMMSLEDYQDYGIPIPSHLFTDKSDAWKKAWIRRK